MLGWRIIDDTRSRNLLGIVSTKALKESSPRLSLTQAGERFCKSISSMKIRESQSRVVLKKIHMTGSFLPSRQRRRLPLISRWQEAASCLGFVFAHRHKVSYVCTSSGTRLDRERRPVDCQMEICNPPACRRSADSRGQASENEFPGTAQCRVCNIKRDPGACTGDNVYTSIYVYTYYTYVAPYLRAVSMNADTSRIVLWLGDNYHVRSAILCGDDRRRKPAIAGSLIKIGIALLDTKTYGERNGRWYFVYIGIVYRRYTWHPSSFVSRRTDFRFKQIYRRDVQRTTFAALAVHKTGDVQLLCSRVFLTNLIAFKCLERDTDNDMSRAMKYLSRRSSFVTILVNLQDARKFAQ